MFCPSCGANNSTEQKFCRACGLNLEHTAQSLLEQIPSAESAALIKQRRALERFGGVAFAGFGMAILLGVLALIYTVFVNYVLSGANVVAGIILILVIIFAAMALAYVFINETLKEKEKKINPDLAKELHQHSESGRLLEEGDFEPPMSVTERTTDLLYTENKTNNFE